MLQTLTEGRRQREKVCDERCTMDVQCVPSKWVLSKWVLMKRTREKDKRETTYDEKIHDNTSAISWEHQDFCVNHAEEWLSFKKKKKPTNTYEFQPSLCKMWAAAWPFVNFTDLQIWHLLSCTHSVSTIQLTVFEKAQPLMIRVI